MSLPDLTALDDDALQQLWYDRQAAHEALVAAGRAELLALRRERDRRHIADEAQRKVAGLTEAEKDALRVELGV